MRGEEGEGWKEVQSVTGIGLAGRGANADSRVGSAGKRREIINTHEVEEEMKRWRREDGNRWIDTGEVSGD